MEHCTARTRNDFRAGAVPGWATGLQEERWCSAAAGHRRRGAIACQAPAFWPPRRHRPDQRIGANAGRDFYSASDWFGFGGTELPFSRMMIDWISKRSNPTRPRMAGPSPSPALPCGAQLHVPYCYFSFLSLRRDCHVVHPPPNDSRGQKERCTTNLARINHFRGVFVICMYH